MARNLLKEIVDEVEAQRKLFYTISSYSARDFKKLHNGAEFRWDTGRAVVTYGKGNSLCVEVFRRNSELIGRNDNVAPYHVFVSISDIESEWHLKIHSSLHTLEHKQMLENRKRTFVNEAPSRNVIPFRLPSHGSDLSSSHHSPPARN